MCIYIYIYIYIYSCTRQSYPYNGPWKPIGTENFQAATFSRQSAHRWRWDHPYAADGVPPPGRFLVLISVIGWVDPIGIVRLEGLGQLKNPVTWSGNKSATFRLVYWSSKIALCCLMWGEVRVSHSDFKLADESIVVCMLLWLRGVENRNGHVLIFLVRNAR
jgi:hypothetical protein